MALVAGVVMLSLVLVAGRTFWPDSQLFKWIWWSVWLVLLSVILIANFRLLVKGKSISDKKS
ncbi:MAG: hypothetical protein ACT4QB_19635 [Gammaproteobacteria bacterium]